MSLFKVALLQIAPCGSQQANMEKGEESCRKAAAMGADVALFPEMWNIGYSQCPTGKDQKKLWQAEAIDQSGPFFKRFRTRAAELNMAIALTYLERWHESPRNSVSLIDRHGRVAMTYAKVHTCDFSMEAACTPGDDFYVADLDTDGGQVKVGAMICYDREFPESARILMLKGAEIILTPNSCGLDANRLGQFRARAFENMVGMVMANYPAPQDNGHSVAYDPIAYTEGTAEEDGSARDTLILEAGEREGIYIAEFDMDAIRRYRNRETWGNSYRKPRAYTLLASTQVQAPFIREDARR